MANFIFDEGASALLAGTVNWADGGAIFYAGLYDDTYVPAEGDLFTDIPAGALINSQTMVNRLITSTGRASADGVSYVNVSPSLADGKLIGIVIYRDSDKLMLYHMDEGFDGLSPNSTNQILGPIFNVGMDALTMDVTFDLVPGLSTGQAWFRP